LFQSHDDAPLQFDDSEIVRVILSRRQSVAQQRAQSEAGAQNAGAEIGEVKNWRGQKC
jgi:hypothetical protein